MRELLPKQAFDRPVSVTMLFIACLVVGALAWMRMPVKMMPDGFEPSFLWVWVRVPDGSPREIDEEIVQPILGQLGTVPGIKSVTSTADGDSAQLGVEFYGSVDMNEGYNAVTDRLERAVAAMTTTPTRYGVWRYNPDDEPVVWAGAAFPDDSADRAFIMENVVQPRLERIPGVAALDLWGVNQRNLEVHYRNADLQAHGVNLSEVQRRLAADNFQSPGGRVVERGLIRHVRNLARFQGAEDLASYPVNDTLRLDDIANVGFVERHNLDINRVNGKVGAAIGVRKESSANAMEVSEQVVTALDELNADPRTEGAKFFVFFNQGDLIRDSMDNLLQTALIGGLFAVVVLYTFLREWRMTLLIAAAIPFSLIMTVGILYARGDSLNPIALMGLMLAVGMVVDNAIVVVETIYRHRAEGASVRDAAIQGTAEVNLAIVLSTATTVVVFLPLMLMSGNATFSFFLSVLGLPVVFALLASLVVALVFAPVSTRLIPSARIRLDPAWLRWGIERYAGSLRWMLTHRFDAGALIVGLFLLTVMVPMQGVSCSGRVESNINNFTVQFTVPKQASPSERDAIVRKFEDTVEAHRSDWGVRTYRARLSSDSDRARLYVYLDDDGPISRKEVLKQVKDALPDDLPGVAATIGWEGGAGGGKANQISLSLHGEDINTLDRLSAEVIRRVTPMPGVLSARLNYESGGDDEMRLILDRAALERYGVDARTVGGTLAYALRSNQLNSLWEGDRELRVLSLFRLEDRSRLEDLLNFGIFSPTLRELVPVRALAHWEAGKGPSAIQRTDGIAGVDLTIDLEEDVTEEDGDAMLAAALHDLQLPRGYSWTQGGQDDRMEDDQARNLALVLSVTFVFLLMGVLFESFVLPLCIITTIPMAMIGSAWGLYLSDTPMDLMAGIGLIILVGVIVNNGIVLIDLVTQLRHEGVERTEALIEAGRRRLRPILMTALTTIFGLLPMAVGESSFIGIPYAPLGRTVMSGLIAGTVLTLLFVPWLYALLEDSRDVALRALGWITRGATAGGLLLVLALPGEARAERPLTLSEAVSSALEHNPNLGQQRAVADAARGSELATRGIFDPRWDSSTSWRNASSKGFFQGFPYDARTRTWDVNTKLAGSTATGTSYALNLGLDHENASWATAFIPDSAVETLQDAYTSSLGVSLTQNLLEGSRLAYNLRHVTTARASAERAELALEQARQQLILQTTRSYWAWSSAVARGRVADDASAAAVEALRVGRLRAGNGDVAPVDLTRLELAEVQARSAALDAHLAARRAADTLLLAMGEAPGQALLPAEKAGALALPPVDLNDTMQVALQQNLDLTLARADLDRAEAALRDARHARLPTLSATLGAGVGAQSIADDTNPAKAGQALSGLVGSDAYPYTMVRGDLSVPLGNRAARGDLQRAEAEATRARLALAAAEAQLRADVSSRVDQLASAGQRVELANSQARLAQWTLQAEEALLEAGRTLQRDVLDARAKRDQAKVDVITATTDAQLALIEVQALIGTVGE